MVGDNGSQVSFPVALQAYETSGRGEAIVAAIQKRTSFWRILYGLKEEKLRTLLHEIVDECRMSK